MPCLPSLLFIYRLSSHYKNTWHSIWLHKVQYLVSILDADAVSPMKSLLTTVSNSSKNVTLRFFCGRPVDILNRRWQTPFLLCEYKRSYLCPSLLMSSVKVSTSDLTVNIWQTGVTWCLPNQEKKQFFMAKQENSFISLVRMFSLFGLYSRRTYVKVNLARSLQNKVL